MKATFVGVFALFLIACLSTTTAAPVDEPAGAAGNDSQPLPKPVPVENVEPEPQPEPKTTVDPETLPISVKSGSASLTWLPEADRRIVDLNWYVDHLIRKNNALRLKFEKFEEILKDIHEEEKRMSEELNRWNMGLFFPGMAHVHETIGITGDILNKVGAKVEGRFHFK